LGDSRFSPRTEAEVCEPEKLRGIIGLEKTQIERARVLPFPSGEVREFDRGALGSKGLLGQGNDHTSGGRIGHVFRRLNFVAHRSDRRSGGP